MTQLGTRLVLRPDEVGHPGTFAFEVYEYAGQVVLGFAFLFWLAVVLRKGGTARGLLLPWLSADRRAARWANTVVHLKVRTRLRLPDFNDSARFAAAAHGLGLRLMTAMALSGATCFIVNTGDPDAGGLVGAVTTVHRGRATLVRAWFVGHSALAFVHHITRRLDLREMWSLRVGADRPRRIDGWRGTR